jgi:hypothetical protein
MEILLQAAVGCRTWDCLTATSSFRACRVGKREKEEDLKSMSRVHQSVAEL